MKNQIVILYLSVLLLFLFIPVRLLAQSTSVEFEQKIALEKEHFFNSKQTSFDDGAHIHKFFEIYDRSRLPTVASLVSFFTNLGAEERNALLQEIIQYKSLEMTKPVYFFHVPSQARIKLDLAAESSLYNTLYLINLALNDKKSIHYYLKTNADLLNDRLKIELVSMVEWDWVLKVNQYKSWWEKKVLTFNDNVNTQWQKIESNMREVESKRIAEEKRVAEEKRLAEERRIAEEKRVAEEKRLAEEKRIAHEKVIESGLMGDAVEVKREDPTTKKISTEKLYLSSEVKTPIMFSEIPSSEQISRCFKDNQKNLQFKVVTLWYGAPGVDKIEKTYRSTHNTLDKYLDLRRVENDSFHYTSGETDMYRRNSDFFATIDISAYDIECAVISGGVIATGEGDLDTDSYVVGLFKDQSKLFLKGQSIDRPAVLFQRSYSDYNVPTIPEVSTTSSRFVPAFSESNANFLYSYHFAYRIGSEDIQKLAAKPNTLLFFYQDDAGIDYLKIDLLVRQK